MKKIIYMLIAALLIVGVGYVVYTNLYPKRYSLNGSYQGEVLNEQEEEIGMYTINFEDEEVTMFSAFFNESFSGQVVNVNLNEYELHFEEFVLSMLTLSDEEVQLLKTDHYYTFYKKSNVPVWESIE